MDWQTEDLAMQQQDTFFEKHFLLSQKLRSLSPSQRLLAEDIIPFSNPKSSSNFQALIAELLDALWKAIAVEELKVSLDADSFEKLLDWSFLDFGLEMVSTAVVQLLIHPKGGFDLFPYFGCVTSSEKKSCQCCLWITVNWLWKDVCEGGSTGMKSNQRLKNGVVPPVCRSVP